MKRKPVIGIEIHAQMNTKTKLFSKSSNSEEEPNKNVELFDVAFPGVFPMLNKEVINKAVKIGLALNCKVQSSLFDRKHYNYPDLPMGFQITQFYEPIAVNGFLEMSSGKKIRIYRMHLETDAGKLVHEGKRTLIDYNRCGVPLMEIVTAPDMSSADDVVEFLDLLIRTLRYTEVCNCNMERGNLRVDINISLPGSERVEIKNVNSINFVKKAIEYEIERQNRLLDEGKRVEEQETRGFNSENMTTYFLRLKETQLDYRYIRDPNIPEVKITGDYIEEIRSIMPELPFNRKKRYEKLLSNQEIVEVLLYDKALGDYFDKCCGLYKGKNNHLIANLIACDLIALINKNETEITNIKVKPEHIVQIVNLIDANTISSKIAKELLLEAFENGKEPQKVVQERGLSKITDEQEIRKFIHAVFEKNESEFKKLKNGDLKVKQFIIGEVMKVSRGKADPIVSAKVIEEFVE